jgi:AcrR family transcriptional regulator
VTAGGADPAAEPRPGRPRSARADDAIRAAAVAALLADGYAGLSIERVAAAAGVAKTTIYRRFAGKAELVADALRATTPPAPTPDTGSFVGDVLAAIAGDFGPDRLPASAGLLPALMAEGQRAPELQAIVDEVLLAPRYAAATAAVRRGIERGELRADVEPVDVVDALVGPIVLRMLNSGGDPAQMAGFPERLAALVMAGLAPR